MRGYVQRKEWRMTVWQKGLDRCWQISERKIKPVIDNMKRELSREVWTAMKRWPMRKSWRVFTRKQKKTLPHPIPISLNNNSLAISLRRETGNDIYACASVSDVPTCAGAPVHCQFVPGSTLAPEPTDCVDALVCTVVCPQCTLIDICQSINQSINQ